MTDEETNDDRSSSGIPPERGIEGHLASVLLPAFVRRRYAAKFVLTLLLVAIIVTALGTATYLEVSGVTQEDAETTLRSTATLQADNVAEWLSGMRTQTIAAASGPVYAGNNTTRIRSFLTDVQAQASEEVVALHYAEESGEILASTDPAAEERRLAAVSPGLVSPVETVTAGPDAPRVGVSTAYERRGELLMAFASQVHTSDGVVIVVADVGEDVEQLHRDRSVVTTRILNDQGEGVLAPRSHRVSPLVDTPEFGAALNGSTGLITRDADVIALAPVPETGWVVRTVAPKDALYGPSRTVGRNVAALVVATLLTLVAIAVVLARQTVLPLVRLRERTEEMAEGDLTVELQSAREDEIGQLYASLARMRDALREQISEAETARDEAERARRELERQNERLETFASTVSHDLRNPLTVARGNVELLQADIGDSTTTVDSEVTAIADAVDRMEAIIDDVLTLTRQGATLESTQQVEIDAVAERAWGSVETGDATLSIASARPIEADPARLQRLFENLFRNAVEHGSTSPRSSSTPEDAVEHGSTSPDSHVTVEVGVTDEGFYVADDGPGIPPAEHDLVFEYGHTTAPDGTGLGLSIVETIAEAHGWSVSVENDDGARFEFSGVFNPDTED